MSELEGKLPGLEKTKQRLVHENAELQEDLEKVCSQKFDDPFEKDAGVL